MKQFWRTRTFWILVLIWIVSMGGHYLGVLPTPYGLIAAIAAVMLYAVLRCLQKRQAGIPWQGILGTSEFIGTSITMLINLLESLSQIPAIPPKVLVSITTAIGFMVAVLHHLSGGTSAAATWASGVPTVASEAITTVEKSVTLAPR